MAQTSTSQSQKIAAQIAATNAQLASLTETMAQVLASIANPIPNAVATPTDLGTATPLQPINVAQPVAINVAQPVTVTQLAGLSQPTQPAVKSPYADENDKRVILAVKQRRAPEGGRLIKAGWKGIFETVKAAGVTGRFDVWEMDTCQRVDFYVSAKDMGDVDPIVVSSLIANAMGVSRVTIGTVPTVKGLTGNFYLAPGTIPVK